MPRPYLNNLRGRVVRAHLDGEPDRQPPPVAPGAASRAGARAGGGDTAPNQGDGRVARAGAPHPGPVSGLRVRAHLLQVRQQDPLPPERDAGVGGKKRMKSTKLKADSIDESLSRPRRAPRLSGRSSGPRRPKRPHPRHRPPRPASGRSRPASAITPADAASEAIAPSVWSRLRRSASRSARTVAAVKSPAAASVMASSASVESRTSSAAPGAIEASASAAVACHRCRSPVCAWACAMRASAGAGARPQCPRFRPTPPPGHSRSLAHRQFATTPPQRARG